VRNLRIEELKAGQGEERERERERSESSRIHRPGRVLMCIGTDPGAGYTGPDWFRATCQASPKA
jgi:hypothetical protein